MVYLCPAFEEEKTRVSLQPGDDVRTWEEHEAPLIQRWQEMLTELHATSAPDFAMFAVANRELLDLAQSSRRE